MFLTRFCRLCRIQNKIHIKSQIINEIFNEKRHKLWLLLVIASFSLMFFFIFFQVPLKSGHGSDPNLYLLKKLSLRQAAEKYAKQATKSHVKLSEKDSTKLITNIFKKADTNGDGSLNEDELTKWIVKKVQDHLTEALKKNFFIFTAIDKQPQNGAISWQEYFTYVLSNRGYDVTYIEKHRNSLQQLPRDLKESIMRDKAAWSEAARDDPDRLSIDEFLAFQHPESSHAAIINTVDEAMARLDMDGDGTLSEAEFCDPELADLPDTVSPEDYRKDRLAEFRQIIDQNKDRKVERKEYLRYVDPRHEHHSRKESMSLIALADVNEDGVLGLSEILMNKDIFVLSKMVDVANSFHNEM